MKWYVLENEDKRKYMTSSVTEDILMEKGWGNGYVAVPPNHSLHLGDLNKISTEAISELLTLLQSLDVHGGLTYNDNGDGINAPKDWWVFGFDTAHSGDTIEKWPKEAVEEETKKLLLQLFELEWEGL